MKRWSRQFVICLALMLGVSDVAHATVGDPSFSSTSYRVVESEVGAGGDFTSNSGSYSFVPGTDDGGSTLGDNAVGNSSSSTYQTNSGFNTTAQPSLTFIINTSNVALGVLSSTVASTATATFSVIDYTSYGYVVGLYGTPPNNNGHQLAAITTNPAGATSAVGTEQFGINTVANTSPVAVGANPAQVPSTSFSYGVAGDGISGTFGTTRPYTVQNNYRYVSGETIASAPKSSGETDYTIAFLANSSITTPGGSYSGNLTLVATGTY